MEIEKREVIQGTVVNFGLISNTVNTVGQFLYADNTYYLCIPRPKVMEPQPHL